MNGFQMEKLARAMKRKMAAEKLSGREAVRQIGIKSSTFYRILNSKGKGTANNLLPICAWLNVPFEHFTSIEAGRVIYYEKGETLDKIEAFIFADPHLTGSDARKLFEIFRSQYRVITNLGK